MSPKCRNWCCLSRRSEANLLEGPHHCIITSAFNAPGQLHFHDYSPWQTFSNRCNQTFWMSCFSNTRIRSFHYHSPPITKSDHCLFPCSLAISCQSSSDGKRILVFTSIHWRSKQTGPNLLAITWRTNVVNASCQLYSISEIPAPPSVHEEFHGARPWDPADYFAYIKRKTYLLCTGVRVTIRGLCEHLQDSLSGALCFRQMTPNGPDGSIHANPVISSLFRNLFYWFYVIGHPLNI